MPKFCSVFRKWELKSLKSPPNVWLEPVPAGSPLVKMPPTYDCFRKPRRTRATAKFFASTWLVAPVRTASSQRSYSPVLLVSVVPGIAVAQHLVRQKRPDIQSSALLDVVEAGDLARFRDLEERQIEAWGGPSILFHLALDGAREVEPPGRVSAPKAQALERDRKLGAPALFGLVRSHEPHGVPFFACLAVLDDEGVDQRTERVRGEVKRIMPVAKGVDEKLDAIVCGKIGITRHLRGDDMLRVGVEAHHPDIEILTVIQQFHCRRLGGSFAFVRLALSDVPD